MINELRGYWFLEHFLISSVGNDHLVLSVLTGFFFFFFSAVVYSSCSKTTLIHE